MKKLIAVLGLSLTVLFSATPVHAATRVLTVYPQQLKDWFVDHQRTFSFQGNHIIGSASFLYPVKLPIGATVTQLKVWAMSTDGIGGVRLVRMNDVDFYYPSRDSVASVDFAESSFAPQFLLQGDITYGPAPARIAAGYHYYVLVELSGDFLGKIQIVYRTR